MAAFPPGATGVLVLADGSAIPGFGVGAVARRWAKFASTPP